MKICDLLPKCFKQLISILAISAVSFCLPAMAQDKNGWQFDSLRVNQSGSETDAQQIYDLMLAPRKCNFRIVGTKRTPRRLLFPFNSLPS
jgi:hypothetical protein